MFPPCSGCFVPGKWDVLGEVLSACKTRKMPPLLPAAFEASLDKLTFLEDADRPLVASLYAKAFAQRLASAEVLEYCGLKW